MKSGHPNRFSITRKKGMGPGTCPLLLRLGRVGGQERIHILNFFDAKAELSGMGAALGCSQNDLSMQMTLFCFAMCLPDLIQR